MDPPNDPGESPQPYDPRRVPPEAVNPYASPTAESHSPVMRSGGRAVAAMVCGIMSLVLALGIFLFACCCLWPLAIPVNLTGIGLGIAAIVLGHRELAALRAEAVEVGRGQATAGFVCGICGLLIHLLTLIAVVAVIAGGMLSNNGGF